MAYDPVDGYTVLFAGANSTGYATNDTWVYQNETWTLLHPVRSPPARIEAAMSWDATDGYVVLFGGMENGGMYVNDTWAFVHDNWTEISADSGPTPRVGASMAWDAAMDRLVLFGGGDGGGHAYNDTWTFYGGSWTRMSPATSPPERAYAATGYDPSTGAIVLFGGWNNSYPLYGDTWAFSSDNWTLLSLSPAPTARIDANMAYLPSIHSLVLFGGINSQNVLLSDTWWLQNGVWVNETGIASPGARDYSAMAAGPSCDCLLLFGGRNATSYAHGTWEYYSLNLSVNSSSYVGEVPFNVTLRSSSSNDVLSTVNWTFGDGSTGSGLSVTHTFVTVGNFTISVVASDAEGAAANLSLTIRTVSPLDLLAVATPLSGISPLPVSLAASAVGGQSPYAFEWRLDSQPLATTPFANATLSAPGSHVVSVDVRDGLNYSLNRSFSITVLASKPVPLSVGILANRTGGPAPLSVALSSWVSGGSPPYASAWSLGDGNTSTRTDLSHTYRVPGTYTIDLTVSDANGDLGNASTTVTVWAPLSVSATVSVPASGRDNAPMTANFTAAVLGGVPPYTVIWEFGNGSGSVGSTTSHRFTAAGTYSVAVRALDATGANATGEVNVTVLPGAVAASGGWVWSTPLAALLALVAFAVGFSTAVTFQRLRRQRQPARGATEGHGRVDQSRQR